MNPDLLTGNLKKKRASSESFWLVGQPDVELRRVEPSNDTWSWQIKVRGFDCYNTKTGEIEFLRSCALGDSRRPVLSDDPIPPIPWSVTKQFFTAPVRDRLAGWADRAVGVADDLRQSVGPLLIRSAVLVSAAALYSLTSWGRSVVVAQGPNSTSSATSAWHLGCRDGASDDRWLKATL